MKMTSALLAVSTTLAAALHGLPQARSAIRTPHQITACAASDVSVRLVTLQCPPGLSAAVLSDALMEQGAMYVSISDGAAGTPDETPIFSAVSPDGVEALESWDELLEAKQLWVNSTLEVGFSPSFDVGRALLSVIANAGLSGSPTSRYQVEDIAPKDWVTDVQSNWPPVLLPGCLTIRFPWHSENDVAALADGTAPDEPVITLHPGMAFGTGEHQTTQLCCLALRELLDPTSGRLRGCTLLDYGSGSGILSFAALRFGAARAVAVEIDAEALETSRLNARENGLGDDAFGAFLPDDEAALGDTYPLLVANILAHTLIDLKELLVARLAPGGVVLMSGVWGEDQVAQVTAAYAGLGMSDFDVRYGEGGWALLKATREGGAATGAPPSQAGSAVAPPAGFVWGAQEVY